MCLECIGVVSVCWSMDISTVGGTVDLEIFVVKIFSWLTKAMKIKKHEIVLTTRN